MHWLNCWEQLELSGLGVRRFSWTLSCCHPLALGVDAGDSFRIPAAFCGVVGFKPSVGEVPHWPPSPFGTLAHAGPMARTVEDCALLMNVLSEPDIRVVHALPRRGID